MLFYRIKQFIQFAIYFSKTRLLASNAYVLDYHEKTNALNGHVDEDLNCFMAKHDRILLITFGSMTNPEPEENTKIILDILQQHQIPAIINTASDGLIEPTKI